eukprot:6190695-Pleurochrysis_carterae.AAC.1
MAVLASALRPLQPSPVQRVPAMISLAPLPPSLPAPPPLYAYRRRLYPCSADRPPTALARASRALLAPASRRPHLSRAPSRAPHPASHVCTPPRARPTPRSPSCSRTSTR